MSLKAERVAKRMSAYESSDVQNSAWKDNKNRFGYFFQSLDGAMKKDWGKNERASHPL